MSESAFHRKLVNDLLRVRPGARNVRFKQALKQFIVEKGDCEPEDHGVTAVLEGLDAHGPSIIARHAHAEFKTTPDAWEIVGDTFIFYEVSCSNGLRMERMWHYASLACAFDCDSEAGMLLVHYDAATDSTTLLVEQDLCWLWYELNELPPWPKDSELFKPREHLERVQQHNPRAEKKECFPFSKVCRGLNAMVLSQWLEDPYQEAA